LCHCTFQMVCGPHDSYRTHSIVRYAEYEYMYEFLLHIYKMYVCVKIRTVVRIFDSCGKRIGQMPSCRCVYKSLNYVSSPITYVLSGFDYMSLYSHRACIILYISQVKTTRVYFTNFCLPIPLLRLGLYFVMKLPWVRAKRLQIL
jgi:hypothetical protein